MGSSSFQYTSQKIKELAQTMSMERFDSYLNRAKGDSHLAISLYECNTALSESLFGLIHVVEISLRNAVHFRLAGGFDGDWFWNPNFAIILDTPLPEMIEDAIVSLEKRQRPIVSGRLVAELSFGFWTTMMGKKYEKSLWVRHLHNIFPQGIRRSTVAGRLDRIRLLRNRIAHHESILDYRLEMRYREIVECISWICPITADWAECTNSLASKVSAQCPQAINYLKTSGAWPSAQSGS